MTECPSGADPKTCGVDPKSCPGCDPGHHQEDPKDEQDRVISHALEQIQHKLLVMSGKGGVGKSSVAVSLAVTLARRGHKVGLMDVDIHGPNVLRMMGLQEPLDLMHAQFVLPPDLMDNLRVISIEVLMRNRDTAVIWRGPLKHQLIRQFLTEVSWGRLDYLIIDAPPGTGDEPMSVAQTIPQAQAVIVTTPQEISLADVRKSIDFCRKIKMPILGLVENMGSYRCPHCQAELPLFKKGGGEKTARAAKVPFLGSLPFDPDVVEAADQGKLLELQEADSAFFQALAPMVAYILETLPLAPEKPVREPGVLKFAIPLEDGRVSEKFGQAQRFAILTVRNQAIQEQEVLPTPPHSPAVLPAWLEGLGVTHVIAPRVGDGVKTLLGRKGIQVIAGVPQEQPEQLVEKYLKDALATGPNVQQACGPQGNTP